jgi:hypothetical protein
MCAVSAMHLLLGKALLYCHGTLRCQDGLERTSGFSYGILLQVFRLEKHQNYLRFVLIGLWTIPVPA